MMILASKLKVDGMKVVLTIIATNPHKIREKLKSKFTINRLKDTANLMPGSDNSR